ncbi:hypothetical protein C8R46DRAFT_1311719 [Mycena filopes]|nr:hypothetical protein C8R46DRAFT_1311719 [Mycena filopes]
MISSPFCTAFLLDKGRWSQTSVSILLLRPLFPSFFEMLLLTALVIFSTSMATPILAGSLPCPSANNFGHPLANATTSADAITCVYDGDSCDYHTDGSFKEGSTACPANIAQVSVMDFLCMAFNLNVDFGTDGAPLLGASNTTQILLECAYSDISFCGYSRGNGSLQSGSKTTCPSSIDPAKNTPSQYDCEELNTRQAQLIGSSVARSTGDLACVYADAAHCTYSESDGTLTGGLSPAGCPPTAVSSTTCAPPVLPGVGGMPAAPNGSGTAVTTSSYRLSTSGYPPLPSDAVGYLNHASDAAAAAAAPAGKGLLAASESTPSSESTPEPEDDDKPVDPVLITLLALSSFLVLAIPVLGALWLHGRRRAQRSGAYARVDTNKLRVPLTMQAGDGEGKYYDDPPVALRSSFDD